MPVNAQDQIIPRPVSVKVADGNAAKPVKLDGGTRIVLSLIHISQARCQHHHGHGLRGRENVHGFLQMDLEAVRGGGRKEGFRALSGPFHQQVQVSNPAPDPR